MTCHESNEDKTYTESNGNQRKPGLGNSGEDLGGLTTNGKAEQDARGSVQVTVAGGEGTSEDGGVNDVWKYCDLGAGDGNDVWAEEGY